jgi:nitrate/nitrite-specific signal transduction histidine kinase
VLTASAPISPLGWTMFVELPVKEAYASLYLALQRLAIVLAGASIFAVLAGIFLARRMVGPIQALRAGAERIGSGNFTQRISINTGDELEGLANQFNDMGVRLQESYADLENKVEQRTAELSESLQQQTAVSDVLKIISRSPPIAAPSRAGSRWSAAPYRCSTLPPIPNTR